MRNKTNNTENNSDSSSISGGLSNLKGWELYSWYDNEWKFALLPGTNRIKAIDEIILNKNVFYGGNELIQNISKLENLTKK